MHVLNQRTCTRGIGYVCSNEHQRKRIIRIEIIMSVTSNAAACDTIISRCAIAAGSHQRRERSDIVGVNNEFEGVQEAHGDNYVGSGYSLRK